MNQSIIQEITYSILSRAFRDRIAIGTTKLVKLLYLIDLEYFRWQRMTLTGAPWVFYHYGPYCQDLVDAFESTDGIQAEEAREFTEGKFFKGYRVMNCRADASDNWAPSIRAAVDSAYNRWAAVDLSLLLDYVYFETAPMLHAVRFEPLDFSVVPDPKTLPESARNFAPLLPSEKRDMLRRKLAARQGGFRPTKPLKVVLDEASEAALNAMGEED